MTLSSYQDLSRFENANDVLVVIDSSQIVFIWVTLLRIAMYTLG